MNIFAVIQTIIFSLLVIGTGIPLYLIAKGGWHAFTSRAKIRKLHMATKTIWYANVGFGILAFALLLFFIMSTIIQISDL